MTAAGYMYERCMNEPPKSSATVYLFVLKVPSCSSRMKSGRLPSNVSPTPKAWNGNHKQSVSCGISILR